MVGADDKASFVKLSLAVVFRSIVFVGLSTFISLYAQQRVGGGTTAGTVALFVLYIGGAMGSVAGGSLANRWDRVTVARWSYLLTIAAVAGTVFIPGPAFYAFVALTSIGLYVPFSLHVTLGQDYLPTRVGTAGGVTLGLTVSIGGLAGPDRQRRRRDLPAHGSGTPDPDARAELAAVPHPARTHGAQARAGGAADRKRHGRRTHSRAPSSTVTGLHIRRPDGRSLPAA